MYKIQRAKKGKAKELWNITKQAPINQINLNVSDIFKSKNR